MKISIVIPVFNEEDILEKFLHELKRTTSSINGNYEFEIVIINDGSTDKTGKILEEQDGVMVLNNAYNLGYGASLKRGIRASNGEWILICDADGTYPINKIPDFLQHTDSYDMIIGKRMSDNDGTSWPRRVSKRFLNSLASWLTHFKIEDINSGMRLFKKNLCMEFWNLYPSGFSFTSTITIAFVRSDYLIKYLPIEYSKRSGKSSIVPVDFFRFLMTIIKIVFYFHPWRIIGPIVFFSAILGIAKGYVDLMANNSMGNLSILLLTLSFLLVLFAFFADLLFKQRQPK